MQKPARPEFCHRNKAASAIEEPAMGNACPHGRSWVGFSVDVPAMRHSFTIAVAQNDRGDFGQELFQRYDPSCPFGALALECAEHYRIVFGERSRANAAECLEMCSAAEPLS